MATVKKAGPKGAGQAAALPSDGLSSAGPLFQPFQWTPDAHLQGMGPSAEMLKFVDRTRDIAAGIEVVLGLLENDTFIVEEEDRPILNRNDRFCLHRLALTSISALREEAERLNTQSLMHCDRGA